MEDRIRAWYDRRTSRWQDWPAGQLAEAKQRLGLTVSVVIPARNEEHTIGPAVKAALASRGVALEVLVLDDQSEDATADVVAALRNIQAQCREIHRTIYELYVDYTVQAALAG